MKRIVSIIAIMMTIPTIAMATDVDIEPGANATCDNGTLKTTDGDVNLRAEWEPHTITLNYYNGDTQYDSNSCTYGGGITLPTQPTRDGYTFQGWRLVQSQQQQQCSLSEYYVPAMYNENVPWDAQHIKWEPIAQNVWTMAEYFEDENLTSGLNAGEWSVTFTEGTIKGRALCSSTNGTYATTGTPNETGGGRYCWCAGTDFGNSCHVSSPSWVFFYDIGSADNCAYFCARSVHDDSAFRRAIFLGQ